MIDCPSLSVTAVALFGAGERSQIQQNIGAEIFASDCQEFPTIGIL
jgi:hypothetical protein